MVESPSIDETPVTNIELSATNAAPKVEKEEDDDHSFFFLGSELREFRHNPCMMRPTSLVMIVIFAAFSLVTLLLQVPSLVLGLLLGPILQRSAWYVEFLYPLPIGRWAHFFLVKLSSKMKLKSIDKNRGFHSRTIEQRYEVVKDRVYIHPLPQWIDNVGYLVVCLPKVPTERIENSLVRVEENTNPIVAFVIDAGETDAVVRAVALIREFHYKQRSIQLQSILSTHKHHDHTGGNKELLQHQIGKNIRRIFGGAVEKVPGCTDHLADGDYVDLPKFQGNDMNKLVEMEVICVPAHTRGSLVYRLRTKHPSQQTEYLFTGDTIFSGGAGVSFEADIGNESEKRLGNSNGNSFIRGTQGTAAMERCFSEILSRAMPEDQSVDAAERILLFPGHDYTQELLSRQFQGAAGEACKWKNFPPRDFFETASHLYLSIHRKSLPHNSGRLLMVPTSLQQEIRINTLFRSLRRSAELVVRAVLFWHDKFCKNKVDEQALMKGSDHNIIQNTIDSDRIVKTPTEAKKWNLNAKDVSKTVFTTVYTEDLQFVLDSLSSGSCTTQDALQQLQAMSSKLGQPVVNKRAIPGFMPSDKSVFRGICGLALLGSKPSAMTVSDSRRMKMPPPVDYNSDLILVSKTRLIRVLGRLGMLRSPDGEDVSVIIQRLWEEANQYCSPAVRKQKNGSSSDEEAGHWHDEIEIGMLKWIMYGVSANQPSWFSKIFCMPCSRVPETSFVFPDHPASKINQKSGDLVSHDVLSCYLCRNVTGATGKSGGCLIVSKLLSDQPPRKETMSEGSPETVDLLTSDFVEMGSSLFRESADDISTNRA